MIGFIELFGIYRRTTLTTQSSIQSQGCTIANGILDLDGVEPLVWLYPATQMTVPGNAATLYLTKQ